MNIIKMKIYNRQELVDFEKEKIIEIYVDLLDKLTSPSKDSQNSSNPPGTDTKSNKLESNKKIIDKKGHKGIGFKRRVKIDKVIVHDLLSCPYCDKDLKEVINVCKTDFQTIGINIEKIVSEHILEKKYCSKCENYVKSHKPLDYPINHYCAEIRSKILYFQNVQHIPQNRIKRLLLEWFDVKISKEEINKIFMNLPKKVSETYNKICLAIKSSNVVDCDETGYRL